MLDERDQLLTVPQRRFVGVAEHRVAFELHEAHGRGQALADVQAVCEHAVILAAGRVLGHGSVAELCQVRNDRYRLRLQGESSAFRTDLEAAGVAFLPATAAGDWRVSVPAGWANYSFFELAAKNGTAIRTLVRDDETLEEFFLRTVNDAA